MMLILEITSPPLINRRCFHTFIVSVLLNLQVCPLSSKATNSSTFESHAVTRFARDGVSFSINTDDPGVILSTINDDFRVANEELGLTMDQLKQSV